MSLHGLSKTPSSSNDLENFVVQRYVMLRSYGSYIGKALLYWRKLPVKNQMHSLEIGCEI